MSFSKFKIWLLLAIFSLTINGCQTVEKTPSLKNMITVSILPQKFFVEKLAGEFFEVNVLVQPGQSPESYEPTPSQMRAVSKSAAYVQIGASFEKVWIEKVSAINPDMKIFDSSAGIERIAMPDHFHEAEQTNEADHSEEELDPHIWTSPKLVKTQVENIAKILIQIDPQNESTYQANLIEFLSEIDQLDLELQSEFKDLTNRKFMVYHPAWGYFARDYRLEQIAIEIGGTEPSAKEMSQIIDLAKTENVKVIFVQPEFSVRSAETIATEIGGKVIPISNLEYNWLENMRLIGKILAESLVQ
jgi:zinc transport system substrate-binding protein